MRNRPMVATLSGFALLALALAFTTQPAAQSFLVEPKELSREEREALKKEPLGSKKNPVRCSFLGREIEYLSRLRCPNGRVPGFKRLTGTR